MTRLIALLLVVLGGLAIPARAGSLSGTSEGESTLWIISLGISPTFELP
jgi:hypothetical protein